jgi:hypothetical protein
VNICILIRGVSRRLDRRRRLKNFKIFDPYGGGGSEKNYTSAARVFQLFSEKIRQFCEIFKQKKRKTMIQTAIIRN